MTPEEIDTIVTDEWNYGQHGGYVNALFDAWIRADTANREMLQPVIMATIKKYGMPTKTARLGKLRERVSMSSVFVIVATQHYVDDFAGRDEFVTSQYAFMKEFPERPVVIVWMDIDDLAKHIVLDMFGAFKSVHQLTWAELESEKGRELLKRLTEQDGAGDGKSTEAHTEMH